MIRRMDHGPDLDLLFFSHERIFVLLRSLSDLEPIRDTFQIICDLLVPTRENILASLLEMNINISN